MGLSSAVDVHIDIQGIGGGGGGGIRAEGSFAFKSLQIHGEASQNSGIEASGAFTFGQMAFSGAAETYMDTATFVTQFYEQFETYGPCYDFTDLSKMWKDTAGTVPVTSADVGQEVARVDDCSGWGIHLNVSESGKRPVLAVDGGRYCLFFNCPTESGSGTSAEAKWLGNADTWLAGVRDFDGPNSGVTAYMLTSMKLLGTAAGRPQCPATLARFISGTRRDMLNTNTHCPDPNTTGWTYGATHVLILNLTTNANGQATPEEAIWSPIEGQWTNQLFCARRSNTAPNPVTHRYYNDGEQATPQWTRTYTRSGSQSGVANFLMIGSRCRWDSGAGAVKPTAGESINGYVARLCMTNASNFGSFWPNESDAMNIINAWLRGRAQDPED